MLIDTHVHLNAAVFDEDRGAVLQRAAAAGIGAVLSLGTDVNSSRHNVELAQQYREYGYFAAVGIHPSDAHRAQEGDVQRICDLAQQHPRVLAIGEAGLDFYRDKTHYREQYAIFREMLQLGRELDLPVVIHNRSAQREMQWFFQEEQLFQVNGVMHCFAGDRVDARFYLEMGLHISFTANITYANFPQDLLSYVPLDRVMLETDSPYMSPAPYTRQRNEPSAVLRVAEKLAEIHHLSTAGVAAITTENARRLFRFP